MNARLYYRAKRKQGGFVGQIYKYDSTGDKEIVTWETPLIYDSSAPALDSVAFHIEMHDIDAELDSSEEGT